jgi:hypothetical protein
MGLEVRFKQEFPAWHLSIEQIGDAPDRCFRVVLRGELLIESRSKAKALVVYDAKRRELQEAQGAPEPVPFDREKWLLEERAWRDIQGMRSEWLGTHGNKARKGGKGGRGGV